MRNLFSTIGRFIQFLAHEIDRSNHPVGLRVEGKEFREIFVNHGGRVRPRSAGAGRQEAKRRRGRRLLFDRI